MTKAAANYRGCPLSRLNVKWGQGCLQASGFSHINCHSAEAETKYQKEMLTAEPINFWDE